MTASERVCMTQQDYVRLRSELSALRSRPGVEVPDDLMDYDGNLIVHDTALKKRIRKIHDLLTNAVVDEDAVGDGIAEPGMVLTIRYDATGETETFSLGRRADIADGGHIKAYSTASPLGRAIIGARPGEKRSYPIPNGAHLPITLLKVEPYRTHIRKRPQSHSISAARSGRLRRSCSSTAPSPAAAK